MLVLDMSAKEDKSLREAVRRIEEARRSGAASLDLSSLNLTTIPDSLAELTSLQTLDLSRNEITAIPHSFVQLKSLQRLDLGFNRITPIPDSLARLANLQMLTLSSNRITTIPDSLTHLFELQELELDNNSITAIPDFLAELTKLQTLELYANEITAIPDSLARLTNLRELALGNNRITTIPDSLSQLTNLRTLYLHANQIILIPNSLAKLMNLRILGLFDNEITALPEVFTQLVNLKELTLEGNPLPEELLAALKRGVPSLFRYLKSSRKTFPRTVKLVLLGEPKSGKTTLLEALNNNPQPCDEARQETIGVNVLTIEKRHPTDRRPMYLSVWDFAGQHIEHATHQFFLTENAIYLILWNARQGTESGKRDLWYWLELLKMRVREPKFLLVATHTEHTPPDLNLSEIERSYKGCQGLFSIELSNLKGFAALQTRILELAAESPSLRAEWPAEWLAVRDEVRHTRKKQPHMTPAAFRTLLKKNRVTDAQNQEDLAGQLHNLGEILYFQDRDELSGLVILNPEWVTELIALVVRSKEVRDQNGILRKEDLYKLWKHAKLQSTVRDHLVHLMDWFDLTYSTGHPKDLGFVVEALPYSTPDSLRQIELDPNQPQMEMIFRFPSLQRHLPPGVPTWGIARAHRFSKATPRRDAAAFEDADTKSQALILASDTAKEVRLRVAADYPPFFFGRLEAILRDTFRRYPGAEPERRLPCPCQPGCPSSYLFETVVKRRNDGKAHVTCDKSGEDVSIESLFGGARRTDTVEGFRALQSEMRRLATVQLQGVREQMEKTCPSVFTLVPSRDFKLLDTWFESLTQAEELELVLYCEHDSGWHPTAHSLYRFRPVQGWFDSMKKHWNQFIRVTKYVAPLAKTVGKAAGASWPAIEIGAVVAEKLPEAQLSLTGKLSEMLGRKARPEFIDIETRFQLELLIGDLDAEQRPTGPKNGGLHPYLIDDGRLLWLCPEHLKSYQRRS